MLFPEKMIRARRLASESLALASSGFRQMIETEQPNPESINAFAKIVEAFQAADRAFATIESEVNPTHALI